MKIFIFLLITLVLSQELCIEPQLVYGNDTMKFCVSPAREYTVKNDTKTYFSTQDATVARNYQQNIAFYLSTLRNNHRNSSAPNFGLCATHYKEFLCVQSFPQCFKGKILDPCVGFCIKFYQSCGFNKTTITTICGTPIEPKTGYSKGLCASADQFAGIGNAIVWSAFLVAVGLGGFVLFVTTIIKNYQWIGFVCCWCCIIKKKRELQELKEYQNIPQDEVKDEGKLEPVEKEEKPKVTFTSILSLLFCSTGSSFVFSLLIFLIFLLVLPIPIWQIEYNQELREAIAANTTLATPKWTYFNSVYYSYVTMTTIGYGDFYPKTVDGKVYMIFYSFFSIIAFLSFIFVYSTPLFNLSEFIISITNKIFNYFVKLLCKVEDVKPFKVSPLMKIMLVLLFLIGYTLIGSYIISYLEGWDFGLAFWWAYISITTIGYGDSSPETVGGRIYFIFFTLLGIGQLTLLIGYIGEQYIIKPRKKINSLGNKSFKINQKEEDEQLGFTTLLCAWVKDKCSKYCIGFVSLIGFIIIFFITFLVLPLPVCYLEQNNEMISYGEVTKWTIGSCYYYCFITLSTIGYGDYFPETSDGKVYLMFYSFFGIIMLGYHLSILGKPLFMIVDNSIYLFSLCCLKLSDNEGHKQRVKSCKEFLTSSLFKSFYIFLILIANIFIWTAIMMAVEKWDFLNSFWWCYITVTTIGYGDIYPVTPAGKGLTVLYGITSIGLLTLLFGYLAEHFIIQPRLALKKIKDTIKKKPTE